MYVLFYCLFFFFKQKTAYDMRISDWSSDVCSSDLEHGAERRGDAPDGAGQIVGDRLGIDLEIAHAVGACPGGDTLDLRHHDLLQRRRLVGDLRAREQDRPGHEGDDREIGSASGRERVCQYV